MTFRLSLNSVWKFVWWWERGEETLVVVTSILETREQRGKLHLRFPATSNSFVCVWGVSLVHSRFAKSKGQNVLSSDDGEPWRRAVCPGSSQSVLLDISLNCFPGLSLDLLLIAETEVDRNLPALRSSKDPHGRGIEMANSTKLHATLNLQGGGMWWMPCFFVSSRLKWREGATCSGTQPTNQLTRILTKLYHITRIWDTNGFSARVLMVNSTYSLNRPSCIYKIRCRRWSYVRVCHLSVWWLEMHFNLVTRECKIRDYFNLMYYNLMYWTACIHKKLWNSSVRSPYNCTNTCINIKTSDSPVPRLLIYP